MFLKLLLIFHTVLRKSCFLCSYLQFANLNLIQVHATKRPLCGILILNLVIVKHSPMVVVRVMPIDSHPGKNVATSVRGN